MPLQVKGYTGSSRCSVCGKAVPKPFLQLKTCCVNKPLVFCSKKCMQVWEARWLQRQEQIKRLRSKPLRPSLA